MQWYHIGTGYFGYPQPEDSFREVTYDPSVGCPTCEAGKKQRAPFRFRAEPKAAHSQFLGLNWIFDQVFVRDVVKIAFETEGITGVSFTRPVKHSSGDSLGTIFQMEVQTVLPPGGLLEAGLQVERCEKPKDERTLRFLQTNRSRLAVGPFCGATKFNYPQNSQPLRLRKSTLAGQPNVVRMREWFGSGGSAGRPILISDKVSELVSSRRWRGLFLFPVEVVTE